MFQLFIIIDLHVVVGFLRISAQFDWEVASSFNLVVYLCCMHTQNFFKRSKKQITLHGIDGSHLDREKKVCKFFESKNLFWIELLDDIVKTGNHSSNQVSEKEAAILWGSICCYPNIKDVPEDSLSMLNKLICNLDRLLQVVEGLICNLDRLLQVEEGDCTCRYLYFFTVRNISSLLKGISLYLLTCREH